MSRAPRPMLRPRPLISMHVQPACDNCQPAASQGRPPCKPQAASLPISIDLTGPSLAGSHTFPPRASCHTVLHSTVPAGWWRCRHGDLGARQCACGHLRSPGGPTLAPLWGSPCWPEPGCLGGSWVPPGEGWGDHENPSGDCWAPGPVAATERWHIWQQQKWGCAARAYNGLRCHLDAVPL